MKVAPASETKPTMLPGSCHCGALRVAFETALDITGLAPRACDCSFCTRHAAAYVSDPRGKLSITAAVAGDAHVYRQGSNNAAFLVCGHCGVLVAVVSRNDAGTFGAVNVRCLDAAGFGESVATSPQRLDGGEKIARWSTLWVPDVTLANIEIA